MFRLRLHPTPSGFALGLAVIALWALLWVWFLAQLAGGTTTAAAMRAADVELTRQDAPLNAEG